MTKSTQIIRTLGIVALVAALAGIIYLAYQNQQLKDRVKQQETADTEVSPVQIPDKKAKIQAADEQLFQAKYKDALDAYHTLLADRLDTSNRAELEDRIKTTRKLIAYTVSSNTKNLNIRQIENGVQGTVRPIGPDVKRPSSGKRETTDSLENKITQLNRQLSSRERALEEKEQLKAIAIQGGDGQTIQYVGDTKNGMAHGTGTGVWDASGGTYKGDWQDNKRHGYGVYNWKDGVRYEGEFRQDKREGKGAYYWPSGERYVGQWQNNQRNGAGILYDKDGNVSYDGNWENDKPKKK